MLKNMQILKVFQWF